VQKILEFTGVPSQEDLDSISAPLAINVFQKLGTFKEKKNLELLIPGAPPSALDLI
jgi:hypothetical protein